MGSYSPVPSVTPGLYDEVVATAIVPTIAELAARGIGYRGVLYAGIMLTADGPKVLEFNCRFGDPETQALIPRLRSDLLELLWSAARGEALPAVEWTEGPCVGVVLASRGYPASSSKGDVITGLELAAALPGVEVFHSGTAAQDGPGGHRRGPGVDRVGRRRLVRRGPAARVRGRRHASTSPGRSTAPTSPCVPRAGTGRPRERAARPGRRRGAAGPITKKGSEMSTVPPVEPEVEALLEGLADETPLVGILMGSKSDAEVMEQAADELANRGIPHEVSILSAHRNPDAVREYALTAEARGLKIIIAGAGKAAALPGVVASYTDLPVIGVPIRTSDLGGLDSLLSMVQMPSGVPVACVAINGARNAGILAAKILRIGWSLAGPGRRDEPLL